ncbi:hypothetical protein SFRURICE_009371 [Spodoptera frugiperda]|nr:hypothetical protein SFRURICE_009371 [Spodoptera frugiperda]
MEICSVVFDVSPMSLQFGPGAQAATAQWSVMMSRAGLGVARRHNLSAYFLSTTPRYTPKWII